MNKIKVLKITGVIILGCIACVLLTVVVKPLIVAYGLCFIIGCASQIIIEVIKHKP